MNYNKEEVMNHPIIKAKIDEFEEKFTKSIPNKNGTIRNPFLMFDCDGGIVNMPYNILKSFLSTALDSAFKAGKEEMEKPLREALRMLEDEIPYTGEEVIAKIKEALK